MGQEVGGDLINMTMIPPLIMVGSALVEESIAVNQEGKRFHDEAGPYDYRVDQLAAQSGRLAWYIFDDRTFRSKKQLIDEWTNLHNDIDYVQIKKKLPPNVFPAYDGLSFNI